MSEGLRQALNNLRETVETAIEEDFLPQVMDWLRSNCNLISVDGEEYLALQAELVQVKQELKETQERYTKPIPRSGRPQPQAEIQMGVDEEGNAIQLSGEAIQDPGQTDVFMERAALMNPGIKKTQGQATRLHKAVNQIRKTSATPPAEGDEFPVLTPAMLAAASPEQIEAMEAQLSGGMPMPQASSYDEPGEALDPVAEALARMGDHTVSQSGGYNPRDVAKLQALQAKASGARSELARGGSVGLIRR